MRALKALVVLMGILIIAGVGLLVYGLVTKLGNSPEESQRNLPVLLVPDAVDGKAEVFLPRNSRFEQMEVENARVFLRFATQDAQHIVIIDSNTGAIAGPFSLRNESLSPQEMP